MNNSNKTAFPVEYTEYEHGLPVKKVTEGLTKLEYFAGLAMQGMLSNIPSDTNREYISLRAVLFAEALIKQLEKEQVLK